MVGGGGGDGGGGGSGSGGGEVGGSGGVRLPLTDVNPDTDKLGVSQIALILQIQYQSHTLSPTICQQIYSKVYRIGK